MPEEEKYIIYLDNGATIADLSQAVLERAEQMSDLEQRYYRQAAANIGVLTDFETAVKEAHKYGLSVAVD